MKKIKWLVAILILSLVIGVIGCKDPEVEHQHQFTKKWEIDEYYHWKKCNCGEIDFESEHSFGDWQVIKAATEEAEGKQERKCTVCPYTATEVIEKLAHTHKFAEEWTKDETNHWHASTCGHEVTEGKVKHTFGDWTITKEPTEEAEGSREKSCTVCEYTVPEVIEKLEHKHKFASEWTSDETNHWHASTCGHEVTEGKTVHSFGDWTITKEPTEAAEGSREKSCTVCEYTVPEVIEKLAHTHKFASEWTSDASGHWHAATCGHKDEVIDKAAHTFGDWTVTKEATEAAEGSREKSCTVCEYTVPEVIEKLAHTHKFASEWTKDETNHWYASTCGHTTEVSGKAAHSFGDWTITKEPTEEAEGSREKSCTVCEYTVPEVIEKLEHKHKFATDWTKDETHHWYAATCGHTTEVSEKAEHSFGDWTTIKEATKEAKGSKERVCTVCNHKEVVDIAKIPEDFVFVKGGTVVGAKYSNNFLGVFIEGRTVTLSDFYMGKYEVTQEEYASVMEGQKVTVERVEYTLESNPNFCTKDNPEYTLFSGDEQEKRPVERVTWYDAVWYCNALSEKEGLTKAYNIEVTQVKQKSEKTGYYIYSANVTLNTNANGYRLPTEAEWEYAARGGDPTEDDWNYVFSGADTAKGVSYDNDKNAGLDSVGWYCYNSINGTTGDTSPSYGEQGRGTHQVGKKTPNRLGLYDMSGNVWEWCYDWDKTVNTGEESDPTGAASGSFRVFRGGDWHNNASFASVSYRNCDLPNCRYNYYLGFRVVRASSN